MFLYDLSLLKLFVSMQALVDLYQIIEYSNSVAQLEIKCEYNFFQVVKMLACVVFIFATLWVPYRGMLVYNTFNAGSPYMDLWFLMFAKTCIYMNW